MGGLLECRVQVASYKTLGVYVCVWVESGCCRFPTRRHTRVVYPVTPFQTRLPAPVSSNHKLPLPPSLRVPSPCPPLYPSFLVPMRREHWRIPWLALPCCERGWWPSSGLVLVLLPGMWRGKCGMKPREDDNTSTRKTWAWLRWRVNGCWSSGLPIRHRVGRVVYPWTSLPARDDAKLKAQRTAWPCPGRVVGPTSGFQ